MKLLNAVVWAAVAVIAYTTAQIFADGAVDICTKLVLFATVAKIVHD